MGFSTGTENKWDYEKFSGIINDGTNNIGELNGIKTSLENISETYNFYKSIKDVFTYYKDNLSETYIKWLVKNFGDDFYEIYYGKIGHPKSFNFVFKKIIYNCNKFFKHAEQMKIYCKNKYEK